jgi:hypothetical protein
MLPVTPAAFAKSPVRRRALTDRPSSALILSENRATNPGEAAYPPHILRGAKSRGPKCPRALVMCDTGGAIVLSPKPKGGDDFCSRSSHKRFFSR